MRNVTKVLTVLAGLLTGLTFGIFAAGIATILVVLLAGMSDGLPFALELIPRIGFWIGGIIAIGGPYGIWLGLSAEPPQSSVS